MSLERYLRDERRYNIEHEILPSEVIVIDCLLSRSVEMRPVYEELDCKLSEFQRRRFMSTALCIAAFWNPEKIKELRAAEREVEALNQRISELALSLAELLRTREELAERSSFNAYEDCHVLDWIFRASEDNYLFESYVHDPLRTLRGQFGLKYWPRPACVANAIAQYALEAVVDPYDQVTKEAIKSPKASPVDYFRALFAAIDEAIEDPPHDLPSGFRLTDESLANLANCSRGLEHDQLVDAEYLKRLRQRLRDQG